MKVNRFLSRGTWCDVAEGEPHLLYCGSPFFVTYSPLLNKNAQSQITISRKSMTFGRPLTMLIASDSPGPEDQTKSDIKPQAH